MYTVYIYVLVTTKFFVECLFVETSYMFHISIVNNNHANETTISCLFLLFLVIVFLLYSITLFYFMGGGS